MGPIRALSRVRERVAEGRVRAPLIRRFAAPSPRKRGEGSVVLFLLLLLFACSQHVTRDRWQHMSQSEKQVYVRSLIGGEKAKSAKGGADHRYTEQPDDYVKRIDEAYSRGDNREPALIFASLAD
jgi:hypothetical protein